VGGNMITYSRHKGCDVGFRMFAGKDLAEGWTLKEIRLNGSYRWNKKPPAGSRSAEFSIIMNIPNSYRKSSLSVTIREIVLLGPKNRRWQEAFGGY
jgi:hypothetical protein